jgi:hypothetical protein
MAAVIAQAYETTRAKLKKSPSRRAVKSSSRLKT